MATSKTFIPDLPASYRQWWLERVYPSTIESLQPAPTGILDPLPSASPEAQRIRTYGHVWHWWGLTDQQRQFFREMG
jgi:hypothetical protein